ncbi:MAG TPA: hypothetical protein VD997_14700 [Phycisphaerales bacterium]|nr:hypothetical protein [Phycisphaerales bacterium]
MQSKLIPFLVLAGVTFPALAQDLSPVSIGSGRDSPLGGSPELLTTTGGFNTLIRRTGSAEDRAMLEFDTTALAGQTLASANILFRIVVNNAQDNGPRNFNVEVYGADGTVTLSDFNIPATVVGTATYHPPTQTFVDVNIDATPAVQALISGGATHVGVRVVPTSNPNFPNVINLTAPNTPILRVVVGGGGCPPECGSQDFNGDGDSGTDQDIEAFFACLGGTCCDTCFCGGADFNGDGDIGTDQDIEAFFRVLGGSPC